MRFLVKATIPVDAGNELVQDPQFGSRLERLLGDLKPETAYFAIAGGQRTMYFIVNVADASQTPAIAEPLWLDFRADVELIPVMTKADMAKATPSIMQAAKKYGANGGTSAASTSRRRARETAGRTA